MRRRKFIAAGVPLLVLAALALLAPWLPIRDPHAQPDGLVLRELPPMSRVDAIALADGGLQFAHEVRQLPSGDVSYRRGAIWRPLPAAALAGGPDGPWHRRPLFLLGTDALGRDLGSRLLHGARMSLAVGLAAVFVAGLLGTAVGLLAGLGGRMTDGFLMRATDLFLAIPRLFLALLLVALYGASLVTTVLVLGATTWMAAARVVRGEVLGARDRDWVQAARASGLPPLRIAWSHLIPAALPPLLVETTLRVGDTILLEAALSFLGLGVPAPTPSWGNLIADGRSGLIDAWWVATFPGLAIVLTVIALTVLGEAIREVASGRSRTATIAVIPSERGPSRPAEAA